MFNPLCHNFIQPFCNVFSNPTTSHSMQDIALRPFSILQPSFLQNDMCYTKAELSLPPAFVQEAMQSRHSRFISIYRIESDRENLNEALWRYVAICGDMARHLVAICCWVDRDFLSVTRLTRLTKKWRDRSPGRACSKGRVHCLVSQKFRHGTFIYFYDLVLVQLPRVKWFELTIAGSRKKSFNNFVVCTRRCFGW